MTTRNDDGFDHLFLVILSGQFDKIHYALAMAASALAVGKQATLFFTMSAVLALTEQEWADLPCGDSALNAAQQDGAWQSKGLAGFQDLLAACRDLGADFMVCEMGLRAQSLQLQDLRQDLSISPGGLATFLKHVSVKGQMIVF